MEINNTLCSSAALALTKVVLKLLTSLLTVAVLFFHATSKWSLWSQFKTVHSSTRLRRCIPWLSTATPSAPRTLCPAAKQTTCSHHHSLSPQIINSFRDSQLVSWWWWWWWWWWCLRSVCWRRNKRDTSDNGPEICSAVNSTDSPGATRICEL